MPEEATERIAVTPSVKAALDAAKVHPRESYGDVVARLLVIAEAAKVKA